MSSPIDENDDNLRYAEYVLGVLDQDKRSAVAREIQSNPQAAADVDFWERRLTPLADEITEITPAAYVWVRIREALRLDIATSTQRSSRIWDSLLLWRWIGISASMLAATFIVVLMVQPSLIIKPMETPAVSTVGYMVSAIQQDNGVTGWTATMDLQHARMVVVPATPVAFEPGSTPELWLIPAGQKPISMGVITPDKPTTLVLDRSFIARVGPTAILAVSVEPMGGSPTGQPTGPVIAKGAISGVPVIHKVSRNNMRDHHSAV